MNHIDPEQLSDVALPNISYRCNAGIGFNSVNDNHGSKSVKAMRFSG